VSTTLTPQTDTRQFGFHPADPSAAQNMTSDHVRSYNEKGYVKGFQVYDAAEAVANRKYFDDLLENIANAQGTDGYSIDGYHTQCAGIWDIATNDKIVGYVQDILGPTFVCWGTHFFCKIPGDARAIAWHQDAIYWPLSPSHTVTVWVAIDDADVGNGCMQVIPCSHDRGLLEFEAVNTAEDNLLNKRVKNADKLGDPVPFELPAGSISLHADMLVHGSEPNLSTRRRCGLTMRYASMEVIASEGWNRDAILCRGSDPAGNWVHNPRPIGENFAAKIWNREAPKNYAGQ